MPRIALRGVLQRRMRAFITTLAVFLGVSFIAGAFVLTDTINASFEDIFSESLEGTDVVVSAETENVGDQGIPPAFSADLLDRARQVDGVEAAEGAIFSLARFVDEEPDTPQETSLDTATAENAELEVGETLRIAGERRVNEYEIVGLTELGETSFGGAAIAQLVLPEAQRVVGKQGKFGPARAGGGRRRRRGRAGRGGGGGPPARGEGRARPRGPQPPVGGDR